MPSPSRFLEMHLGKRVEINLKDGSAITGTLAGFDEHLNMVIAEADELGREGRKRHLGEVVLRGSNVVGVSIGS